MGADIAVILSATFNSGHFWSAWRALPSGWRARRAAAAALALLNAGLAALALYLLALGAAHAVGRDTAAFFGGAAFAVRIPALLGSLLVSALLLRDRIGGPR